ncbi:MAG TPA: amidohydrolase family protein, partial [Nakamurella sp.]|nr:amidohydrolase family protein [Nakamurella sp.]
HTVPVRDGLPDLAAARVDTVQLQASADVPEGSVALVGGTVITMHGGVVHAPGTVIVRGNRIAAVGDAESVETPAGATVIDCAGRTLMPGLIDAHGHIDGVYGNGVTPQKQAPRFAALAFGVTTNFDPYPSELPTFESTETTQAGLTTGPRWIGTGSAIHGRPHNFFHLYTPLDSYADALRVVGDKKNLGAIAVKSYKWPARRHRQMLVKAAREHGVNIVVEGETHFYNNVSMILDGHTNLEHNFPVATVYDDVVQLMALAGVSNTPTLVVAFGELFGENWAYQHSTPWKDPRVRTYIQACLSGYSPLGTPYEAPPHSRAMTTIHVADELYDVGVLAVSRSVQKLDDAGVRINAGSHGEMPGLAMHWEMNLLAEGGMAPERVLRTATINSAESLGVGDQIGSLEVGKLADLIVLAANPLEDIRNSSSVIMTMVNGRLYDAETLDQIAPNKQPRSRFYWEVQDTNGIDWSEAWGGGCG